MPRTHEKKVAPEFFVELLAGRKNSEYRLNDCGYSIGDVLHLREYFPPPAEKVGSENLSVVHGYTGREIWREITHVLTSEMFPAVPEQWVILSLREIDEPRSEADSLSTKGVVPPSRILNAALTSVSTENLNTIVILGWVGEGPREEFFMAMSHDIPETSLLLDRGTHEVMWQQTNLEESNSRK